MTDSNKDLTHFDTSGQAHMVDVGDKEQTKRIAVAAGSISMQASTLDLIKRGDAKQSSWLTP